MKNIMLFEEFNDNTLDHNISAYNQYYYKNRFRKRSEIVAWSVPDSQEKNFKLVSKYLKKNETLLDYGCGIGDLLPYLYNKNKIPSKYLGVDINEQYINLAKETYTDNDFKLIKSINEINGKWDSICAIGVFTWYIEKKDFINTINKLYNICNKQLLITCLYNDDVNFEYDEYWKETYRYYNEYMFMTLFPDLNFEFEIIDKYSHQPTMLVRIIK